MSGDHTARIAAAKNRVIAALRNVRFTLSGELASSMIALNEAEKPERPTLMPDAEATGTGCWCTSCLTGRLTWYRSHILAKARELPRYQLDPLKVAPGAFDNEPRIGVLLNDLFRLLEPAPFADDIDTAGMRVRGGGSDV